jgi:hypothetical protein
VLVDAIAINAVAMTREKVGSIGGFSLGKTGSGWNGSHLTRSMDNQSPEKSKLRPSNQRLKSVRFRSGCNWVTIRLDSCVIGVGFFQEGFQFFWHLLDRSVLVKRPGLRAWGMGMKRRWAGESFSRYREMFGGDGCEKASIAPSLRLESVRR